MKDQQSYISISLDYLTYLSLKPVYPTIGGENFHVYRVQIIGKLICKSKNRIFLSGSFHHPSRQRKLINLTNARADCDFA